jgi:hypothetical protein
MLFVLAGMTLVGCGPTGPSVAEPVSSSLSTAATRINCGSTMAVAPFAADMYYSNAANSVISHTDVAITTTGVTNPAPLAVYQTGRIGNFSYTIPGFVASAPATVRLHFAETFFTTENSRVFTVAINGTTVLTRFDIIHVTHAKGAATVQEFAANADGNGSYTVQFTSNVNNSLISGIEVIATDCLAPPAPGHGKVTAPKTTVGATATYSCDAGFTLTGTATRTCQTSGAWSGTAPTCVGSGGGNGSACSTSSQCASGFCAGGVCCNEACTGVCNSSCSTGVCTHAPARTSCGTRTITQPGTNDIALECDGAGNCVAPTIGCGGTPSCSLAANVCCMVNDPSTSSLAIACTSPSSCQCGPGGPCDSSGDQRWYACKSSLDCPTGKVCGISANFLGNYGYQYTECIPALSGNTWTNEACDPKRPASQCVTNAACQAFESGNEIYGECLPQCVPGPGRCCTNADCGGPNPTCDPVTHSCTGLSLGNTCTASSQCASGFCTSGVCCSEACNGPCDSACTPAGVCTHKPVRTSCGTKIVNEPGQNDIALECDAAGNCAGPTISCGGTQSCSLGANVCCMTTDPSTPVLAVSCTAPSNCQCGPGGLCDPSGDQRWYACKSSLDCPLGKICGISANYLGNYGYQYTECIAALSGNTWTNEACDPRLPATQCQTNTACLSFGDGHEIYGECVPQCVPSAGHCCTDSDCGGGAMTCDLGTHQCTGRQNGNACTSASNCASGFCSGGVCCNEACTGVCSSSCATGTCVHAPARTSCGSRALNQPGLNDIALSCDGNGQCVGALVQCGATRYCSLTSNICCMTSPPTDPTVTYGCVASASQCQCGGPSSPCSSSADQRWYACKTSLDCPSGMLCGYHANFLGNYGYQYAECITVLDGVTWTNELCDPRIPTTQCVTGTTCTAFGTGPMPTFGECSP